MHSHQSILEMEHSIFTKLGIYFFFCCSHLDMFNNKIVKNSQIYLKVHFFFTEITIVQNQPHKLEMKTLSFVFC